MLRRLAGVGLRWRLAAGVAAVVVVCLAITFVAVYEGTGTQVRGEIDTQIKRIETAFASSIEGANPGSPAAAARVALEYIESQPFRASSITVYASVAGCAGLAAVQAARRCEGTSSNDPSLVGPLKKPLQIGYSTRTLPGLGDLRLIQRVVPYSPRRPSYVANNVVIGVAESLAPVARAQEGVARAFILAGALALVIALLGAYLIGSRISRPLRRMAAVAARVDGGDLNPRIPDPHSQGAEIGVLADAFNNMLDRLTKAFASQRAFVADASHELRTPITVIRGQLEVLASRKSPSAEEVRRVDHLVQAEISRISRLIDDLLLLAKSEHAEFLRVESIDIAPFIEELWQATTKLAERRFVLEEIPAGRLLADPDRLAQALRNLLTNAIKHTAPESGLVRMRVEVAPSHRIRFVVEDDGPGIPVEERERVFDRFHRTDPARARASGGTGLGLAIVAAIASAHGGSVRAGEAPGHGAKMVLELPQFEARVALRSSRSSPSRTTV